MESTVLVRFEITAPVKKVHLGSYIIDTEKCSGHPWCNLISINEVVHIAKLGVG